ncbi:GNAT family N-acetyltransferase [Ornithinimicrobium sp. F0845]|uniref:GNAT family N-acetyltransferase n=1 Tax=Ornithinimicrobium sp. F0845 TaxID=2926412 RepID=UPI001FF30FD6|nr:GNAT family N-acetyltransferase [Ornithinimicrobium sp. F0845]MCK0113331.1 GNAT family N-acetyltransferase [Ornithinimicrobium sp. F0845]
MDVAVVTGSEGLAGLRTEWEELERAPGTPYYVTHRFVTAWWESYRSADGYRLHVVTVRQDGRLVAIAPCSIRPEQRAGKDVRVLRWASHGDYLAVLYAEAQDGATARPETLTRLVMEHLSGLVEEGAVASVHLTGIPSESQFAWQVRKSQDHHRHLAFLIENPYLDLGSGYSRPSHTTKYRNKLLRDHQLRFAVFQGAEHDILDRIAAVHVAEKEHLHAQGRPERHSLFEDDRRVAHIRGVFEHTDDAITFALVEGDDPHSGRIAAYRTVFNDGGRLLSWNSAYLPAYEPYRMGKVLQLQILEHLESPEGRGIGATEFDFGAGKYPWKFEWTPTMRPTYRLLIKATEQPAAARPAEPRATEPAPAPKPAAPATATAQATPTARKPASLTTRVRRRAVRLARDVAPHLPAVIVEPARRAVRARRDRTTPVVIWYIPHPDDETIFMGGSIASQRERRNVVVLLTDGEASQAIIGTNRKLEEPITLQEFVASRGRELAAAVVQLGVRERDIIRVGLPDGSVTSDEVLRVVRDQARRFPLAAHRTMSYLDVHGDHAAAGAGLREAHRRGIVQDVQFHLPVPQVIDERATWVAFERPAVEAKLAALREYCVWDPEQGRYAVGRRSVSELIAHYRRRPDELVHGPDLDPLAE